MRYFYLMKHMHLRSIILLGTIVLICLLIVQVYWFNRAFDAAERQFDHNVQMALKKVADSVTQDTEIKKLSSNFFFVETNSTLNEKAIAILLEKEFAERNLTIDFEFGVYYAHDDTLVYGHYIEATKIRLTQELIDRHNSDLEKNFAIYFPRKESYLAAELDIWIFSTLILILMIGFFGFAIASLLREKKFAELKNDFINNMIHEFKIPVTNIKIAGEILSKKVGNTDGAAVYIDVLLRENEKLRQKIDKVLSGASADYLKSPVFETMNVHQLIENCAEAFQLKVQQRRGSLKLELLANGVDILGDRELLTQALNNVIDNAEKYSSHQPSITIHTKDIEEGIEINIIDKGTGIASNMKSKVFEKFFRIPTGDVHNVKGFGLGLNFAKNVIQKHSGKIKLFSQLHKGTSVIIVLPKI